MERLGLAICLTIVGLIVVCVIIICATTIAGLFGMIGGTTIS